MEDKETILTYLKEKSGEDEVLALLQRQKRMLADQKRSSVPLDDEIVSLIVRLAGNSKGKIKYHALITLSRIDSCTSALNFHRLCKIAASSSNDKDGNVRQASFILIRHLNALMIMIPFIHKSQHASEAEVNLVYESFRNMFYRLHFLFYNANDLKIRRSILRSLEIVVPKMQDMAEFWNDREEMRMIDRILEELRKGAYYGVRD